MMFPDWKKAPDSATHYRPDMPEYYEAWFRNISTDGYQINIIGRDGGWETEYSALDSLEDLIPRPKPELTQEFRVLGQSDFEIVGGHFYLEQHQRELSIRADHPQPIVHYIQ